jgi:hypothetical protein
MVMLKFFKENKKDNDKKYEYKLTISEPWNFEDDTGSNVIRGNILKKINDDWFFFECEKVLKFESTDIESSIVLLTSRYEKEKLSDLFEKRELTVNGAFFLGEIKDAISDDELNINSSFLFIAGIEKIE